MWENRVMEERTSQIFKGIQKKKLEAAKEAEEAEHKHELLWKEQGTKYYNQMFIPVLTL